MVRLFNFPKGVFVVAFGNLWDTFSYYGTQTVIVLYLIHTFGFSSSTSYLVYGTYAAMAFSTPVLGGVIADRFLGSRNTLIFGSSLSMIGNLILMIQHESWFYAGLAITLIGSGLYKSNSTQLLGALYKNQIADKEKGFTLLYLAINVGGTLAPIVYGLMIYKFSWSYGFLASAIGLGLGLLMFLIYFKTWPAVRTSLNQKISGVTAILLAMLILFFCFRNQDLLIILPVIVFACGITYILHAIQKLERPKRKPLFGILALSTFAMFYFAAGMQIGTTITLFIQSALPHLVLPASTFNMLYSGFVLILAPLLTLIWAYLKNKGISIKIPQKVFVGILLASIGIFIFSLAAKSNIVIPNVVLGYLFLSAGELVITPAVYTAISNNSPDSIKGAMMGCWFLFIGMGSFISGMMSKASKNLFASYTDQFIVIGLITLTVAILLLVVLPKLSKIIK